MDGSVTVRRAETGDVGAVAELNTQEAFQRLGFEPQATRFEADASQLAR